MVSTKESIKIKELKMAKDNEKYLLQSVETSLSILDLFIEHEELSAADVSRLLNINRSKAFRFLVTLENCDYVTRVEGSKYRLGAKVSTLSQTSRNRQELINLIHPYIANISEITGESTHTSVLKDSIHSAFIDKCVGSRWLTLDIAVGYSQFAHASASGKCMLAYESEEAINSYIRTVTFIKYTDTSISTGNQLLKELEEIRANGYGTDAEQVDVGLTCYAVPILVNRKAIAAISISGPTTRMIRNKDELLSMLKDAEQKIEEALS